MSIEPENIGGIDPHQHTFTVGIVDANGAEITHARFDNNASGYIAVIDLLNTHRVRRAGIEGSASWGDHVAIAIVSGGFDAGEVPATRSAGQRRARQLDNRRD